MAQSEKVFRDTLCESRSYGVETSDPTGARIIDELRRQTKELRAYLEAEKARNRQILRDHEKRLYKIREEEAMRLDTALEACSMRKEQEKNNEIKKVEERLEKQRDQDFQMLKKEKMEELNSSLRKWQMEKNEALRAAAEVERRKSSNEFHAHLAEDEAQNRIAKLTREVFILGEQNEALEVRVKNLSRLNLAQIDQMRKMKLECEINVEDVIKKHKAEASREMAQIKLAEQIIAEKDHHLQTSEYRADLALIEKEALEEQIVVMKSLHNTSGSGSVRNSPQHDSVTPNRRTGVVYKRVEELENQIWKLEEERGNLKQDNASLRKRLIHEGEGKKAGNGEGEGRATMDVRVLRKKNSELMALIKQLDDKYKAVKAEQERMQKSRSSSVELDQKKSFARQHVRDISEYTKQIHNKDKELTMLKKKLGKLEVAVLSHSEPTHALEKKVKSMSMDKLQMERLMAKFYCHLPDVIDIENLSHKDLASDSRKLKEMMAENQTLQDQLQTLQQQVASQDTHKDKETKEVKNDEDVDGKASAQEVLLREKEVLVSENERLKNLAQLASKLEAETFSLHESVDHLESTNATLEQHNHELRQKLQISSMAVKELEGSHELAGELEKELNALKDDARLKGEHVSILKMEAQEAVRQLTGKQIVIITLQKQLEQLSDVMRKSDQKCTELQAALDRSIEVKLCPRPGSSIGTQVDYDRDRMGCEESPPSSSLLLKSRDTLAHAVKQRRQHRAATASTTGTPSTRPSSGGLMKRVPAKDWAKSSRHRSLRSLSPKTSSGDLLDSSLDYEMRAAGFGVNDSFDSSEGGCFSDPNLDGVVLDSDPSLEARDKAIRQRDVAEEKTSCWVEPSTSTTAGEKKDKKVVECVQSARNGGGNCSGGLCKGSDQNQPTANGVDVEEQRLFEGVLGGNEGDSQKKPSGEGTDTTVVSGLFSHSTDDPTTFGSTDQTIEQAAAKESESDGSLSPPSEGEKVGIYIAKYSYIPFQMSPNQNFDLELQLTAGDYLYVYGEMDDDGFYHGQLLSGESGMVPSNFIERVMDDEEPGLQKPQRVQSSELQDIQEVDEDASSRGQGSIPPPHGLTLERQFVEDGQYSVAIQWKVPRSLPTKAMGYAVYVNGEFSYDVSGSDQTSVLLTGIPRKQLVKISVHTVTEEGESTDPAKLIILNPQYPEPPTNVKVSLSVTPCCLAVQWTPSQYLKEGNQVSGYVISLNEYRCMELGANPSSVKTVSAQIFYHDVKEFKHNVLKDKNILLTVHALSGHYMSTPSVPVMILREDFLHMCRANRTTADESERTSSATSLSSIEDEVGEERETLSTYTRPCGKGEEFHPKEVEIVTVGSNGVQDTTTTPANGRENGHAAAKFYRALAHYNPHLQSPNKEFADEELAFLEDDIIICLTQVDEDGFLMGELDGKSGYVPGNLVEEVTDEEDLAQIRTILQEKGTLRRRDGDLQCQNMNGGHGLLTVDRSEESVTHKMKAVYDYDPTRDSPNENCETELALKEGNIVTVFGWADSDGYVMAEIAGKRGVVPCNFLEEVSPSSPPKNDEIKVFSVDEHTMKLADAIIKKANNSQPTGTHYQRSDEGMGPKRKGGLLNRGKNLLTKNKVKKGEGE